jgi:hypothetical protein
LLHALELEQGIYKIVSGNHFSFSPSGTGDSREPQPSPRALEYELARTEITLMGCSIYRLSEVKIQAGLVVLPSRGAIDAATFFLP